MKKRVSNQRINQLNKVIQFPGPKKVTFKDLSMLIMQEDREGMVKTARDLLKLESLALACRVADHMSAEFKKNNGFLMKMMELYYLVSSHDTSNAIDRIGEVFGLHGEEALSAYDALQDIVFYKKEGQKEL